MNKVKKGGYNYNYLVRDSAGIHMNVASLFLTAQQKSLLISVGFSHLDDFKNVTATRLSEELQISYEEAFGIMKMVKNALTKENGNENLSAPVNALELFEREKKRGSIVTFCESLDEMLGGGVPAGKITEFCGVPGIGKTQMGLQLAVDVQIPNHFGGLEGKAIYIDTEGSFIMERLYSLSSALVNHLNLVNHSLDRKDQCPTLAQFSVETILSNILVYRCPDYTQLLALSHLLPDVIKRFGQVKLIVVDSIALPFRHGFEDLALRTRILTGLAQTFMKVAHEHELAVVVLNQMTTAIKKNRSQMNGLVPALGDSWAHACTIRVILFWEGNSRLATLQKSPSRRESTVAFQINGDGVRGVVERAPESQQRSLVKENCRSPFFR